MSITRSECASTAEASSAPISTREPALVLDRVVSVCAAGRADVYNITVADEHEFYANGILVSNCDCLRYWLMSRPRPFSAPHRIDPDMIVRQPSLTHDLMTRQF